jgi:tetraacyldisaccharide 4'-kinase
MRKILFPVSWIYGFIIFIRNLCYDKEIFKIYKFNKIIISVGNITAGGTGKTPTVEFLINYLMKKDKKIAVVSRGYKRKTKGSLLVSDGKNLLQNSENSGDEPFQIANKFPGCIIGVDEKKSRMTDFICKNFDIDVVLLDDAFQHRKINRDFDIVCINPHENPFKESLLPAGNRREQLTSLKRADYILINKCRNTGEISEIEFYLKGNIQKECSGTTLTPDLIKDFKGNSFNLEEFKNKKAVVFSGIGDSDDFKIKISGLNISIHKTYSYRDHYSFMLNDMDNIIDSFKSGNCDIIITTEKDYNRIYQNEQFTGFFNEFPFYYLSVKLEFLRSMEQFTNQIDRLFHEI